MIRQTADKFILFSGGAIGADTVFGSNAEFYGITEQNYSFRHHKTCRSRGRVILNSDQLELANHDLLNVVGDAFRKHQESGSLAEKYWQRNWYQVRQTKEIFAVVKNIASLLDFAREKIEGTAIGIALAITSSFRDTGTDPELTTVGEVGLSGELRAVPQLDRRVNEAAKLGFKRCLVPKTGSEASPSPRDIELIPANTVRLSLL